MQLNGLSNKRNFENMRWLDEEMDRIDELVVELLGASMSNEATLG